MSSIKIKCGFVSVNSRFSLSVSIRYIIYGDGGGGGSGGGSILIRSRTIAILLTNKTDETPDSGNTNVTNYRRPPMHPDGFQIENT